MSARNFLLALFVLTAVSVLILTECDNPPQNPLPTLIPVAALPTADMESLLATGTPFPTPFPGQEAGATPTWPQAYPAPNQTDPNLQSQDSQPVVVHPPVPNLQSPAPLSGLPVNGVPPEIIVRMPPETVENVRAIYARGQQLGRNPRVFSKLGDSSVLTGEYLTRFENPSYYNLGDYSYLQPTVDYYAGSFGRYGTAVRIGLSSFGVMDPAWTDKTLCGPGEHMLRCEIRLNNPSIFLLRLGTNDGMSRASFEGNMREILDYIIEQGVIPILATKADRFEGDNRNNEVLYQLAAEYKIPLWDFDAVAQTLPGRGLTDDNAHLTTGNNNYTDPANFGKGYPMNDLTALMALDAVLHAIGINP